MLFNSFEFIILFLPITLIIFLILMAKGYRNTMVLWLVLASLFFYGWWSPVYLFLIAGSIIINFSIGYKLALQKTKNLHRKFFLTSGIILNIGALTYFKYYNFFTETINIALGTNIAVRDIIIPLAISFFTFQQIAYLVDAYRKETKEYKFLDYCLFVTFFPQLIAGPIVHHKEMMPQFFKRSGNSVKLTNIAVGSTIFFLGLFKKVVLADGMARYATPVFDAAHNGDSLAFFEAWTGVLAYTFQIYFDFSGYSDMAIGAARLFGVRLPINFNSPYKSINIIDFWRRWHITLSRFLKDYLYIPLGGNRRGRFRKYTNLMVVMLIGGLWHGASYNFLIWGGLHGIYLVINNLFRKIAKNSLKISKFKAMFFWLMTFVAVVFAWVPFRAQAYDDAKQIWLSLLGYNGFALPPEFLHLKSLLSSSLSESSFVTFNGMFPVTNMSNLVVIQLFLMLLIVLFMPNTQQIMRKYRPGLQTYGETYCVSGLPNKIIWRMNIRWGVFIGCIIFFSIISLTNVSEFLYFQF